MLYEGPTEAKALWEDPRFRYRTTKSQRGNRIVRTRPLFYPWSADVLIAFNDEMLNPEEVDEIIVIGGHSIGLLEERPEYGRYSVEKF